MRTRAVFFAKDQDEKEFLLALELLPKTNEVKRWVAGGDTVTEEVKQKMYNGWRNVPEQEMVLTEKPETIKLTASNSLLPEGLTIENLEIMESIQLEWNATVLGYTTYVTYESEIATLNEAVLEATSFDKDLWQEMRDVQGRINKKLEVGMLTHRMSYPLKRKLNKMFKQIRRFKREEQEKSESLTKEKLTNFSARVKEICISINASSKPSKEFSELKNIQKEVQQVRWTPAQYKVIKTELSDAFELAKSKLFSGENQVKRVEDTNNRLTWLTGKSERLQHSLNRDIKERDSLQKFLERGTKTQIANQMKAMKLELLKTQISEKEASLSKMKKSISRMNVGLKKMNKRIQSKEEE